MNPSTADAKSSRLAWHAQTAERALESLNTTANGLNQLPETGSTPLWRIFLRQFANPLIYVLVAAALVSLVISDAEDALFIGVVIIINATIGASRMAKRNVIVRRLNAVEGH